MFRTYSELRRLHTFEDRYDYLQVKGGVGTATFGSDRYLNQQFYTSRQWQLVRDEVIARDLGMDLGVEDHEIFDRIIIHHMNPMTAESLLDGDPNILDPEFLITTTHKTHNAIHFGEKKLLAKPYTERSHGDTTLWSTKRR